MSLDEFLGSVQVASDEDCEKAAFVVCMKKSSPGSDYFSDNLEGSCHDCGAVVVFRPYMPKKPPRICMECLIERSDGGRA